jgi:hypothetical protein
MTAGSTRPDAPGAKMDVMSGKARTTDGPWSHGAQALLVARGAHGFRTQGAR